MKCSIYKRIIMKELNGITNTEFGGGSIWLKVY